MARPLVLLVACAALALAVGGCGSDDEPSGGGGGQTEPQGLTGGAKAAPTTDQGLEGDLIEFPESADEQRSQFVQRRRASSGECDVFPAAYEGLTVDFLEVAFAAGGSVLSEDGAQSRIDSPAVAPIDFLTSPEIIELNAARRPLGPDDAGGGAAGGGRGIGRALQTF